METTSLFNLVTLVLEKVMYVLAQPLRLQLYLEQPILNLHSLVTAKFTQPTLVLV